MLRYFIDGKEVTKEQAEEIKKNNDKCFSSGKFEDMQKIKFIVETNIKGEN